MTVRLMVLGQGTTLGQARSDAVLLEALRQDPAFEVFGVTTTMPRLPARLRRQPLVDLVEAWALRSALRRAVATQGLPDAIVLPTTTAALLQPQRFLRRAALRFDTLAAENRPGPRGLVSRWLEGRALRHVPVFLPYSVSEPRAVARQRLLEGRQVAAFPTPIATIVGPSPERSSLKVVAYGANPDKKGLDWVIEAWRTANLPAGAQLHVAGIARAELDDFLHGKGLVLPHDVFVHGPLAHADFISLMRSASIYLAAARYEDFGIAPLEAMGCGALVVTMTSRGPFEASRTLRVAAPDLLTPYGDVAELAAALERALDMSEQSRSALVVALRDAVEYYSEANVLARDGRPLVEALRWLAQSAGACVPARRARGAA